MNLILLLDGDLQPDGTARLTGRRARHVREVHRAAPGDTLVVGKLGGLVGQGTVVSVAADEVVLSVALTDPPPAPPGIDLILAMPRPKMLRRLLEAITSLGVKRLVLLNSYRVEKSYFDSPLLEPATIAEHLVLGLEQGRDTVMPEVLVRERFKPFVEDELDAMFAGAADRFVAHPIAPGPIEAARVGAPGAPAVVAIGPEGGWIPYEVGQLEARGFQPFSLGPRILRVDTAVPYVFGQIELARRRAAARG